jgi:lipoprotein signal peptidase
MVFGALVLAGLALDLATKHWAWSAIGEPPPDARRVRIEPSGRVAIRYQSTDDRNIRLIGDRALVLCATYNPGAFAGIGGDRPLLLLAITLLMVPFILWFFHRSQGRWELVFLAMILAGALGNLYDRSLIRPASRDEAAAVIRQYQSTDPDADLRRATRPMVRDFISVDLGFAPLNPWPTFNAADSLLSVGVAGLVIFTLFAKRKEEKPAA